MNRLLRPVIRWSLAFGLALGFLTTTACSSLPTPTRDLSTNLVRSNGDCGKREPLVCRVDTITRPGNRAVPVNCGCSDITDGAGDRVDRARALNPQSVIRF